MFFLIYLACGLYLWLLGAAVFGGWERRSLFRAPWLGYAVLIACLQIAHFFTAINPAFSWTFLAISLLCAGGIVALRFRKVPFKAKELPAMSPLVWFALLIAVAWLAFRPVFNIATQKIVHYDVGYYYLQTIAWTTAFPIVPGLGNLLLELGFNQSAFLVPSLFDSLGPHLWGYSLLGGVLPWLGLTLSGFALLQGLCAVFVMRKRLEPIEKAYAISLPAWIYTLLINNISANSPDIALACLQIHLFLCFASFLAARGSKAILLQLSELIILGALSLCVKLNSIFFVAAIGLLSIGVALTRIGAPRLLGGKQVLYATLAALVLCLPWIARGIVSSGYPLFPSTALAAPVAWRVPKADVSNFYDSIVHLGRRQPDPDLAKVQSGFAWIPEFLRRNWDMKDQFATPLSLGSLWALLLLALAWKNANFRRKLGHLLLMILARGIRLGHVVFHRSRSQIPWVDHLASAARCLACLDLRHFTLGYALSSRSLSASITLLSARCAITPSGPGRNGLPDSRRSAESISWKVTIPLAFIFTIQAKVIKRSMPLSRARRLCIPR